MLVILTVLPHDVERSAHRGRDRERLHLTREVLEETHQTRILRTKLMEQCGHAQLLELLVTNAELASERHRPLGDAIAVTLCVLLTRLEMEGQQLEHRDIRVLEITETRLALIRQRADGVPGEDEETSPRNHREHDERIEARQPRESFHCLHERDE